MRIASGRIDVGGRSDPIDILLMIRARGIDVPFRFVDLIPSEVSLTLAIGSKINDDGSYQNCLTKKDLKLRIWS